MEIINIFSENEVLCGTFELRSMSDRAAFVFLENVQFCHSGTPLKIMNMQKLHL